MEEKVKTRLRLRSVGKNKIFILYTLLWGGLCVALLSIFNNVSLIKGDDAFHQYYPVMVYISKYIRSMLSDFLHGNFILRQYDFSIGLGDGIIPALNYYGFGDPILLILGLIPVRYSEYAYTGIIFLKIWISGICFILYCRNRGMKDSSVISGAMVYIASIYVLYYGFHYPTYLNVMISLPLLCMGIDRVIENGKISYAIILSVAFQAFTGFYQLYMVLLFAAIYALFEIICRCKDLKMLFGTGLRLLGQVLLGCLLAGIILFPALAGFFYSSRSESFTSFGLKTLFLLDGVTYWEEFSQIMMPLSWSVFSLGIPLNAVLAMIEGFSQEKAKAIKYLTILMVILYIETFFTSWIAGGFSDDIYYNRWLFCLTFLLSYFVSKGMEGLQSWNWKRWGTVIGVGFLYMVLIYVGEKWIYHTVSQEELIRTIRLYCIYWGIGIGAVIICRKLKAANEISSVIILLGTILNVYTMFGVYGATWNFKPYNDVRNEIQASNTQKYSIDKEFGRYDVDGTILNESLYFGYYGTSEYLSILNRYVYDFYEKYAITDELFGLHQLKGLGSRQGIEDLLSVEYYDDVQMKNVVQNADSIPLGTTFDSYISQNIADSMTAIERNASILNTVILEEHVEGIKEITEKEQLRNPIVKENKDISYINIEWNGDRIKVNEESKIIINLQNLTRGESYFYSDILALERGTGWIGHVYINGIECKLVHKCPREGLICLGKFPDAEGTVEITFGEEAEYRLGDIHIYTIKEDEIQRDNECRRTETLQNLSVEKNTISGEIEVDADKILFMSIPYSSGWKVYVNGKTEKIMCADYGFMAIRVCQGVNSVKLVYSTPGLRLGICCTIASILFLILMHLKSAKQGEIHEKYSTY